MYNLKDFNPELGNSFDGVAIQFNIVKKILNDIYDAIGSGGGDSSSIGAKVAAIEQALGEIDPERVPSTIRADIYALQDAISNLNDILFEDDPDSVAEAIDTWQEIKTFLDSVEDTTLNAILAKFVRSDSVKHIVTLTQSEYDALSPKVTNTEYNII